MDVRTNPHTQLFEESERSAVASDILSLATFVHPCTADMRRAGSPSAAQAMDGRKRPPRDAKDAMDSVFRF